MKKFLLILLCLPFIGFAQTANQGINYQAAARDASGDLLINQTLTVKLSVISDLSTSAISWQETHQVITNDFGLFIAFIGQGTATNGGSSTTFDLVDWGSSTHFLKVEIDYGSGYVNMGTKQLLSVPYALHTEMAGNADSTDELQSLSISGDTIFISKANFIVLPVPAVLGCTDSTACNYSNFANTDDGSCLTVYGCTDSLACNYDISASCDNGSCLTINGCLDTTAFNYDASATCDDGSCIAIVYGCTDSTMFNFDLLAHTDDGSCTPFIYGCTDSIMYNYNVNANTDDTCIAVVNGCIHPSAFNFNPLANNHDNSCIAVVLGCMDSIMFNYDSTVNTDNGSCVAVVNGCTDYTAFNYNVSANIDDGSCIVYGCTDSTAHNYNTLATNDYPSGSTCISVVYGCIDFYSFNYSSLANTDDGSCVPVVLGCIDTVATNYNSNSNVNDGSCIINGCTDSIACNYNADATVDNGSCTSAPVFNDTIIAITGDTTFTTTGLDCAGNCLNGGENTYISLQTISTWGSITAGGGYWTLREVASGNLVYYGNDDERTFTCLASCYEIISAGVFQYYEAFAYQIGPDAANLGALIVPGDFGASATDIFGSECLSGCTDANAFNYDLNAINDDSSCVPIVYGCIDVTACNFDSLANTELFSSFHPYNSSCTYPAANTDCDGNCLLGVPVVYTYGSSPQQNIFRITTCDGIVLDEIGSYNGFNACIELGDNYTISLDDSFGNGWNNGNLNVDGVDYTVNCNWCGWQTFQVGDDCPVYGCMDSTMFNYNSTANIDDGSCIPILHACTDSTAGNYNPSATHDDGSCTFQMTYVPDDNFEEYLERYNSDGNQVVVGDPTSMGNGILNDNYVKTNNIKSVTNLDVSYKSILDLTGIEDFTALTNLKCFENIAYPNKLSSLNVSQNTNLTYLDCSDNTITSLDLSNNIYLEHLVCYGNNITSLNLSNNTFLTVLRCENNQLTFLDIKNGNNINITSYSSASNPQLICINVDDPVYSTANWTGSYTVDPISNFDMLCIPINGCIDVVANNYDSLATTADGSCSYSYTYVPDDGFEQALINLGYDNILDNYVNTLVIEEITSLDISASYISPASSISDLTGIEDFTALTNLGCAYQDLTSIDLSQNIALTALSCYDNYITSLDLSQNIALTTLTCFNNQITSLDLSTNTALTWLSSDNNQLTSLNLRNGNNYNFNFLARNNPSLTCISVDDAVWSTANWSSMIDATSYFSDNCENGCTDPTAINFRAEATVDDGSCTYCSSTPYCENFDAGIGGWTNNGWSFGGQGIGGTWNGNTPSSYTGPSDDMTSSLGWHTNPEETYLNSLHGLYMFMEVIPYWYPEYTPTISLTSECFKISELTTPTLAFKYHMYGEDMGTLDVLVNGTNVWSLSGNQGNQWEFYQVDLSAFTGSANLNIEFRGTVGPGAFGDMAIDEVCVGEYLVIPGCTDTTACNYFHILFANQDDGSCLIDYGCMDTLACNFDSLATCDDGSCNLPDGCADTTALNHDPSALCNDNSCCYIAGCTDITFLNYNVLACSDDGSCCNIPGCMDTSAPNYNEYACMDVGGVLDSTCIKIGDTYEGGIIFYLDGNGGGLVAAPEDAVSSPNNEFTWDCAPVPASTTNCYECDESIGNTMDDNTAINTNIGNWVSIFNPFTNEQFYQWTGGGSQNTNEILDNCHISEYRLIQIGIKCEVCNSADNLVLGSPKPEMFFRLKDANGVVRYTSAEKDVYFPEENDYYLYWQTYIPNNGITANGHNFRLEDQEYTIVIIDRDDDEEEVMGSASFPGYTQDGYVTVQSNEIGSPFPWTDDITVWYDIGSESNPIGAAKYCKDLTLGGYSDWFLPSKDELIKMKQNIGDIAASGETGYFGGSKYWSSSNAVGNNAISICFRACSENNYDLINTEQKDEENSVRAIRAFEPY